MLSLKTFTTRSKKTVNEETSAALILNSRPDFISLGIISGLHFFAVMRKIGLTKQKVQFVIFCFFISNCTCFKKPRNHTASAGFTLIEVLVVIGLLTVIFGSSLFFDVNTFRGDAFRAERANLVTALETARADALNNINQSKHGVAINPSGTAGYVIFEGENYATSRLITRVTIPAAYKISLASTSPSEVVFSQLSGDTGWSGELILVDNERQATTSIVINYEGKIGW